MSLAAPKFDDLAAGLPFSSLELVKPTKFGLEKYAPYAACETANVNLIAGTSDSLNSVSVRNGHGRLFNKYDAVWHESSSPVVPMSLDEGQGESVNTDSCLTNTNLVKDLAAPEMSR